MNTIMKKLKKIEHTDIILLLVMFLAALIGENYYRFLESTQLQIYTMLTCILLLLALLGEELRRYIKHLE